VVSPIGRDGKPTYELTDAEQNRIAEYFRRYKLHDPKTFPGCPDGATRRTAAPTSR
jgi:hypothetical protein